MKCIDLVATQYVMMADCGGHVMQKGDVIMVDERVADRMCLQHKLTKGDTHEVGKLQHGHWQLRQMTIESKEKVVSKPDVPADKSMGTQDGKPKKKATKKAAKKG